MARGIIYVMTTVVPGLIKLGRTGVDNFESRMYNLERHGYSNVVGLKRKFAIEVEDYVEKETLLDDIFSKSKVPNTELFALDIDLVVQLLSSFEGIQIYPELLTKEEVFEVATKERQVKADWARLPDGVYYLDQKRKGFGQIRATMRVVDGVFIVEKGSDCAPITDRSGWIPESRLKAPIENNVLQDDVICTSPSAAGWIVIGASNNGWTVWRDADGRKINTYRQIE